MTENWNGPSPKRPRCKVEGCPATPIVGVHPAHSEGDITYNRRVHLTEEERQWRREHGLPDELSVEYTLVSPKEQS